jgi:hypothetical protein
VISITFSSSARPSGSDRRTAVDLDIFIILIVIILVEGEGNAMIVNQSIYLSFVEVSDLYM